MSTRNAEKTKARILSVAQQMFAELGFDKARVDGIAEKANVNKALIYYYFKSKQDILDTLISSFIEETKQVVIKSTEGTPDIVEDGQYQRIMDIYINYFIEKRNILKIIMAESVKASSETPVIMQLGEIIGNAEIENIRKSFEEKGLSYPAEKQELLVMEFFTGLMPFITFALYKEAWVKHFNVNERTLHENFHKAFKNTNFAAHMKQE